MYDVQSAGGLIFDDDGRVLLVKSRTAGNEGQYNLPKGHVEPGETVEQAAVREMFEETGYHCEIIRHLGEIYRKSLEDNGVVADKRIDMFEMRITGGDLGGTDEEAEWVAVAEALTRMKHPEETEFLNRHL